MNGRKVEMTPDDRIMLAFLRGYLKTGTVEHSWVLSMLKRADEAHTC